VPGNRVRKLWLLAFAAGLAIAGTMGFYDWIGRVHGPPKPAAATLPASAREFLRPFRKESLDLTVGAHQELTYRVGMQAGATLVYAWSSSHVGKELSAESPGQKTIRAAEAHGAFEARSSGWYRWHWKNESGNPVAIHLKLSGYYEDASMPYDR
jgi:hypothetical protein